MSTGSLLGCAEISAEWKRQRRAAQLTLLCVYLVSTLGGIIRKAFLVRGFASSLSLSYTVYTAAPMCILRRCTYLRDTKQPLLHRPG